ncbi:PREDICTED: A disintegrin and metalloproteinase with thrombospondin motifs 16-like [Priapulus caudatus]|uniref:A disintegrin and metalloproteinase with thrombospondin motifs 16-like n=1 Tax=Priapulus caudatus TaxID=37621 RepID=A0ABM1DUN9_PRICU|nr:PREDICTED: A disintegrin and metalloproteinase with thrombospondin motifs 16-like [Priapulus caudatus]
MPCVDKLTFLPLLVIATVFLAEVSAGSIHHLLSKRELKLLFGANHHTEVPDYKLVVPRSRNCVEGADEYPDQLFYTLDGFENSDPFHLTLYKTGEIASPELLVVTRDANDNATTIQHVRPDHCHYLGNVTSHANSVAAMSSCDGLTGIIATPKKHFMLHPVPRDVFKRHKRSLDGTIADETHFLYEVNPNDINCPVNERLYEQGILRIQELEADFNARSKRQTAQQKKDKVVELAIFYDHAIYEATKKENDENDMEILNYVLATINGINLLYHQRSLGDVAVTFKLVRLEIMKAPTRHLPQDGDAEALLSRFRVLQEQRNPAGGAAGHWDNAVLITGYDMYVTFQKKKERSVTGYAHVGSMCERRTSCSINEGKGFGSLYSIAHEIGHNFGMVHDGYGNTCAKKGFLMSAESVIVGTEWSRCSNEDFNRLIRLFRCLDNDNSESTAFKDTDTRLIGQRYDADMQCQVYVGNSKSRRSTGQPFPIADICRILWCSDPDLPLVSRGAHPALDGTYCGNEKWCRAGKCTSWGDSGPDVINGDWSLYTTNATCLSNCLQMGSGYTVFLRECNNPKPQNGGEPCKGSERKIEMCDDERVCRRRKTAENYGRGICKSWHPNAVVDSRQEPIPTACAFRCKVGAGKNLFRLVDRTFPDGKNCGNGKYCVDGKCVKPGAAPIDGGWSEPELISDCDSATTCLKGGVKLLIKRRTCTNPAPDNGGSSCVGSETITEICRGQ